MSDLDLEAIKARAAAATPGPWERPEYGIFSFTARTEYGAAMPVVGDCIYADADADFIAHAREDMDTLVAEVERLRERIESLERLVWADDEVDAFEEKLGDLMRATYSLACTAERPRPTQKPWLKLSSYEVALLAANMTYVRMDLAEEIAALHPQESSDE